jgi:tRNA(adenine34) deaminase
MLHDPTAHAEMIAITSAAASLESWRLLNCTMYVTLEPCAMCAGALVLARIPRLVVGTLDPKAGACGSVLNVADEPKLNHRVKTEAGVLSDDCAELLRVFFRKMRLRTEGLQDSVDELADPS